MSRVKIACRGGACKPASKAAADDLAGDLAQPAAVDLQIQRRPGLAFRSLQPSELPRPAWSCWSCFWRDGSRRFPTLVTCRGGSPCAQALAVAGASRAQQGRALAALLGASPGGPVSWPRPLPRRPTPSSTSAPPQPWRRPAAESAAFEEQHRSGSPWPRIPRPPAVMRAACHGASWVSLGHSAANRSRSRRRLHRSGFDAPHSFNAMPGLHHRAGGSDGRGALRRRRHHLGLIADGVCEPHHGAVLLQRLGGPRHVGAGQLDCPRSLRGSRQAVTLDERTFAGGRRPSCPAGRNGTLGRASPCRCWRGCAAWPAGAAAPGRDRRKHRACQRWVLGDEPPVEAMLVGASPWARPCAGAGRSPGDNALAAAGPAGAGPAGRESSLDSCRVGTWSRCPLNRLLGEGSGESGVRRLLQQHGL